MINPRSLSWIAPETISLADAEISSVKITIGFSLQVPVPLAYESKRGKAFPSAYTIRRPSGINSFTILMAASIYPPVFPRKSMINDWQSACFNLAIAVINSLYVVRPNLLTLIYPIPSLTTYETSTVLTGTSPRVTSTCNKSGLLFRLIPSFTVLFFAPRNVFITLSRLIFVPEKTESLMVTIRSKGFRPAFSEGPPGITLITRIVSVCILKETPIPLNDPSKSSETAEASSAEI